MPAELFTREELQEIRDRARELEEWMSHWMFKRAFGRLAVEADCLDAMMARAEETSEEPLRGKTTVEKK